MDYRYIFIISFILNVNIYTQPVLAQDRVEYPSECPSNTVAKGDGWNGYQCVRMCEVGSTDGFCNGSPNTDAGAKDKFTGSVAPLNNALAAKGSDQACIDQIPITQKYCKTLEWMNESMSGQIANGLLSAFTAAKSAGNTKAACEAATKINTISTGVNAASAAVCQKSVSTCISKCSTENNAANETNLKTCQKYETYAKLAVAQTVSSAAAMVGSQACVDAASGECSGEKAFTNSMCQEFCFKAANANHAKCVSAAANCQNPSFAAQNVQYCTCLANPLSASCRAGAGTPVPGTTTASVPNLGEDGIGDSEYDFNGASAEGAPAKVNSPSAGGGGFGGGGGGSSAFGEGGGGGNGDDPLNKEILTGTGGSAGGGGGFFGGGGYGDGGGKGGSGSSTGEEKGLDLSQFLPGGKKDPTRNPASAGYDDPTITKANGLTNWQKVTRKINEKRPELMP